MRVVKQNFPSIIPDNELTYFSYLVAITESIDSESTIQITNKISGVNVRISPSHPRYLDNLIKEMKAFHTGFGIQLEFSKSMKNAVNINFNINI